MLLINRHIAERISLEQGIGQSMEAEQGYLGEGHEGIQPIS
jgi:hypothetical protein